MERSVYIFPMLANGKIAIFKVLFAINIYALVRYGESFLSVSARSPKDTPQYAQRHLFLDWRGTP